MVLCENAFLTLTLLGAVCLAGFGAFIACLFIPITFGLSMGRMTADENARCNISQYNESQILFEGDSQYPPRVDAPGMISASWSGVQYESDTHWVAHWCTPAQWWFNVCVKYFSFYFTFVNALPLPWTISIFMHAFYPRRKARGRTGVDFYGARSNSIWFHLPLRVRKRVSAINLVALIVQIPDAICHVIFYSYLSIQVMPGVLITNVWLGIQVACQITASIVQSNAEDRVRERFPLRFPPTMGQYLREAYRRWVLVLKVERLHAGFHLCCGTHSFYSFVRVELHNFQEESKKYGRVSAVTGVHHNEIGRKQNTLYRSVGTTGTCRKDILALLNKRSTRRRSNRNTSSHSVGRFAFGLSASRSRVHPEQSPSKMGASGHWSDGSSSAAVLPLEDGHSLEGNETQSDGMTATDVSEGGSRLCSPRAPPSTAAPLPSLPCIIPSSPTLD